MKTPLLRILRLVVPPSFKSVQPSVQYLIERYEEQPREGRPGGENAEDGKREDADDADNDGNDGGGDLVDEGGDFVPDVGEHVVDPPVVECPLVDESSTACNSG